MVAPSRVILAVLLLAVAAVCGVAAATGDRPGGAAAPRASTAAPGDGPRRAAAPQASTATTSAGTTPDVTVAATAPSAATTPNPASAEQQRPQAADVAHVYAVVVNGGGRREINYRSHLQHVRTLVALLAAVGVPAANVAIFSADGSDEAADLATRESAVERGAWLLPASVAGSLGPIDYVSSAVEGFVLRPAKLDGLRAWFADEGAHLHAGDTVLFYVTDHGDKNENDLDDNTITLWGEALPVHELQALLETLPAGVRVVLLMSQCYAGAFARLMYRAPEDALPSGDLCGFFAAPRDRPAYGCYPENRGKDGVGHSHHFLAALDSLGRFSEAAQRVLVTDDSPDIPHATSDVFYEHLVRAAAERADAVPRDYADALIAKAWQDRGAYEPEIRLLDRIGQAFGSFSPRSVAELDEQSRALPELSTRLKTYADRWRQALDSLRADNFARFLDANPEWRGRISASALATLDANGRSKTSRALLAALVPFTGHDATRHARLLALKRKADDAAAAHYRAEVRVGVVRRLRGVLLRVAGKALVAEATDGERSAAAALERCEAFTLAEPPASVTAASLPAPRPFPVLADEQRLIEALLPAYMGIEFRPLDGPKRARLGMRKGAVTVMRVYEDSPAERAGLQAGDVIVGPPNAPFDEPEQVREWTMRRQIDVPAPLTIWRDAGLRTITLRPGPYPLELPKLPGPPKVGSAAPPLDLELFHGKTDLAAARPRLLFFWATWCSICKQAVPEILAFERLRNVEVVAVTDESADILQTFFHDVTTEFPTVVAMDPLRRAFRDYGVSGTPTFVLIDGGGAIRHYQTGYPKEGLRVEGWHWREDEEALSVH